MTDTEYIKVIHRELPYSTFDSDNHLYENRDALTKFLAPEYEGLIKYVDDRLGERSSPSGTRSVTTSRIRPSARSPFPAGPGMTSRKVAADFGRDAPQDSGRWSLCRASTLSSTRSLGWSS